MLTQRLHDLRLRVGDLLLVHGSTEAMADLAATAGLVPLGEIETPVTRRPRSLVAVGIMIGVVTTAGLGQVPIVAAAFGGVVLMIYTGCVRLDEVYDDLDWTVVVLLAGLLPLGLAMDETGAARLIGSGVAELIAGEHPAIAVAAFYIIASLLTEAMSNNAAAAVLTPIALGTAASLEMNPYALLIAVMFGASASFMTPVGYQTNTLIYGPGGYRFSDFPRVGGPLNLLLLIVVTLLIPVLWPT
jgi:di/tricarboxylate transporter